jgi:lysozyme family protein
MTNLFPQALQKVLVEEGGYSNNPHDPGGATDHGIIQTEYNHYRVQHGMPMQNVQSITDSEVSDIYLHSYWLASRCDLLPPGVSLVVFDGAVNSGVHESALWLQRAVGATADGIIGPKTIAAANSQDRDTLIDALCDERLHMLEGLANWRYFGHGWGARVERLRANAKAMVNA